MNPFSVVIAGGGVAAIEGLLRLRRLAGEELDITLLAPNDEFAFRALSVREPFSFGAAERHPIRRLADDTGAEWVQDTLAWVDPAAQVAHTGTGSAIGYDALLIAVGGRMVPAFRHVETFRDDEADEIFRGVVQDIESGFSKSVAFIAPEGLMYLLPLYELALMTAARAADAGMDDVDLCLITPEPRPLAGFGDAASDAIEPLLDRAGITVHTASVAQVPAAGQLLVQPDGIELHPQRMVSMPRISGPGVRGLAGGGADGFLPIDEHCAVKTGMGRVFAAGDATDFHIKHGGLGAQQADAAAAAIAHLTGMDIAPPPFHPVIRGKLLTGAEPLYLSARLVGSGSFESEVAGEPLWPLGDKVAAEELNTYLAGVEALR